MDPNALLMLVLLIFVGGMLYLSSRTRKRQMAAHQAKLDSVSPGVRVTTIAGLQGTVTAVADDTMELEIAPGVRTTWLRAAVRDVVDPATQLADDTDGDAAVIADAEPGYGDAAFGDDSVRSADENRRKDLG